MGTVQSASALNGVTLNNSYIYSVSSSSISTTGVNGVNSYSGSVAGFNQSGLSGSIVDTSSGGNGSIQLTSPSGNVSNYLVLGSSSNGQNLVLQSYTPGANSSGSYYLVSNNGSPPSSGISFNSNNNYLNPTCFASGTFIMTADGEIPVERLKAGDIVITTEGDRKPIRWIGYHAYDCGTYIKPTAILPVLIVADAIMPGVPCRDTLISEGHSILLNCVSPVLVPIHSLINGITIRQINVPSVKYFHIELDNHAVIIANNMPSETFLDCGNRSSFETIDRDINSREFVPNNSQDFCYPRHEDNEVSTALYQIINTRSLMMRPIDITLAA